MASEFVIDGHYFTSPNQQKIPPTLSFGDSDSLPELVSPTELRKRVWAHHNYPYLPFVLNSPFQGVMVSRLATPPEQIHITESRHGFHLPADVTKSWKTLEQSCRQAAFVLRSDFERYHPEISLTCTIPTKPSEFGYFSAHSSEEKARSALSESLDAFAILFAYVSFFITLCRDDPAKVSSSTSTTKPRWLETLSARKSQIHPEWLQLLVDSRIADFTTGPQRLGAIVNVARCSWLHLVPYMLKANVPIWLYWGAPPAFAQPLDIGALRFAPRSHPQSRATPLPATNTSQPVGPPVPSAHGGSRQIPGESWKEFLIRQNHRRKARLEKEDIAQRTIREDRETTAAKKSCPGKRGPTVYVWEEDNGVWTRTLLVRREVEDYWGDYRSSQRIYNSIDNCWDLCYKFDEGNAGEVEDDSNSGDDIYPDRRKQVPGPTPSSSEMRRSGDTSDGPSMPVAPPINLEASTPVSVLIPAQVAASSPDLPHPNPRDASDGSSMHVDLPSNLEALTPVSVSTPAQVGASSPELLHPNPRDASDGSSMHVDPPSDLEAPTPVSVWKPAQVGASSHELPHPNPQDASDGSSMHVDPPSDLETPTPVSVSKPAQVGASSHELPHHNPRDASSDGPSMLVDPPSDLEALTPVSVSKPAQVGASSHELPHLLPRDASSDGPSMLVDPPGDLEAPVPLRVSTPAQVAASSRDLPHPNPQSEDNFMGANEDDEDKYDASRQDVLNAYSFVALDLEQMPITTLDDLLYYRYGFSLNENPYTGIPASVEAETKPFRSWTEVCRAVGGQQLESSGVNCVAIEDFLSILAGCKDPFKDVPGKYWDLSPSGRVPIVDVTKAFISIEEKQFTNGKHYIIHPRFLHPSRDTSWILSVDSMTALELIRRGLGPHSIDIANFLITHGVRFRTLQRIKTSLNSRKPLVCPQPRYLGYRSVDHVFDLGDFAGYEAHRDSFLCSQTHGPLALREGGIIARLAREVLPNCIALSGPSSEALSGHRAIFACNDEIYVEDDFLESELKLICGTYALSTNALPKHVSWFPPPNIWNSCGYNVGQWTEECEKWFQDHVSKIHCGTFQPLSSKDWRTSIRNTRAALKLTFQMKKAAADHISAHQ